MDKSGVEVGREGAWIRVGWRGGGGVGVGVGVGEVETKIE